MTPLIFRLTIVVALFNVLCLAAGLALAESIPSSGEIAFLSFTDGQNTISLLDVDRGILYRPHHHPSIPYLSFPVTWSPEGNRLLFVGTRAARAEIFVMGLGSDSLTRLTTNQQDDMNPAWSPDGNQVVFVCTRRRPDNYFSEICLTDTNGGNHQRIRESLGDASPVWSPDGRKIAFVSYATEPNPEIMVATLPDGQIQRLTTNDDWDYMPAWSPDSQRIAFVSAREGYEEIYVMDADGGSQRRLTHSHANSVLPVWSPDGRHIVFQSLRDQNREIYVMGADGTNERRLTHNTSDDFAPVWSPDGRQIVFVSARDSNAEIYVMDADGGNQRRLTYSSGSYDTLPRWRP